eukprot:scaffold119007_cov20-Tisochrysis_lutea.AAC.1
MAMCRQSSVCDSFELQPTSRSEFEPECKEKLLCWQYTVMPCKYLDVQLCSPFLPVFLASICNYCCWAAPRVKVRIDVTSV